MSETDELQPKVGDGRPWDGLFSSDEIAAASAGEYGRRVAASGRAALLIIDVVRGFTGYEGETFAQGVERFRQCCGPYAWQAIPPLVELVGLFRRAGWPIIFTRGALDGDQSAIQRAKNSRVPLTEHATRTTANEFLPELVPAASDLVIEKSRPSAFFRTPLLDFLRRERVERLVVTGCTTSGCIRATVNDGFANDVPMLVPHECVFDRFPTSHQVNLFDINAKYADVLSISDLTAEMSARATA